MSRRRAFLPASAVFALFPAFAQQPVNVNFNVNLTTQVRGQRSLLQAHRSVTPFGIVAVRVDVSYSRASGGVHLSNNQGTLSFIFNRLDSFDVAVEFPDGPGAT